MIEGFPLKPRGPEAATMSVIPSRLKQEFDS